MRARLQLLSRRWIERVAWLCLFWFAGVAAMAIVAWGLRGLMRAVGLAA